MVTYTYRQIRRIDTETFCRDILSARLYDSTPTDADEYAELLDSEEQWRTRRRRRGQHDIRHLSDDAKQAKQERRRLERRYQRTGFESDRRAYQHACRTAGQCIQRSRADEIREKLDAVLYGDVQSTWHTARSLLHMDQKAVHDDTDCQKLVSTFSQFFADKVSWIRANIASAL